MGGRGMVRIREWRGRFAGLAVSGASMIPTRGRWVRRGWFVALGLLCLLGIPTSGDAKEPKCPDSESSISPSFDFHEFTKKKPFPLNTCMTTPYGPAWADVLVQPENFLQCQGASIALCYYSG